MTAKPTIKKEEIITEKIKECFIITPIGNSGSEIFSKTEGLINSVLKPVLEKFNFKPIPAHYISDAGSINRQIIEKIVNCELVIANLTTINPNVMYELAIRHSFGKKVITMAEHGTKLPFDIVDQRTIFYEDSMIGVEIVKPQLEKALHSCLNGKENEEIVSNPIYDAINQFAEINAAIKDLPKDQQDGFSMIMNRLDNLENQLIEKTVNKSPGLSGGGSFQNSVNRSNVKIQVFFENETFKTNTPLIKEELKVVFNINTILTLAGNKEITFFVDVPHLNLLPQIESYLENQPYIKEVKIDFIQK